MARHAPPPPAWHRWLAARLDWRPRPRTTALAAAALVVAVVAALLVAPSPDVDTSDTAAPPSTSSAHADGAHRWPTVVIPTIGDPGKWTPPGEESTSTSSAPERSTTTRCSRCGEPAVTTPPEEDPPPTVDPDPEPQPQPDPTVESQPAAGLELVELVNRDRLAAGCDPVALHPSLVEQSQAWSEQQAADDEMHHSPGVSGFDTWGENVAVGYDTAAAVHDAWMASPGHRANVLDCAFTLIGYGAADGASGRYWTEQFAA